MNNKIVYAWYHNDEIFYVGIGSIKRSQSARDRNSHCANKRAKAERENSFSIRVLFDGLSWDQACKIEQELISEFGRRDNNTGILTNMTDGGEGAYGRKHSKETIKKMSNSKLGENNPSYGKKGKDSLSYGMKRSEETKAKLRKNSAMKGTTDGTHPRSKTIHTPLGIFGSQRLAAKAHGTYQVAISRKVRSTEKRFSEYYFTD